jgi:hypothetical protein
MVLSDTRALRDVFGPCAVFVRNVAAAVAAGVVEAHARRDELATARAAWLPERRARSADEVAALRAALDALARGPSGATGGDPRPSPAHG